MASGHSTPKRVSDDGSVAVESADGGVSGEERIDERDKRGRWKIVIRSLEGWMEKTRSAAAMSECTTAAKMWVADLVIFVRWRGDGD